MITILAEKPSVAREIARIAPERAWRFFDKKFEFLIPSLPLPHATKMTPDAVLDGGMETEAYA